MVEHDGEVRSFLTDRFPECKPPAWTQKAAKKKAAESEAAEAE